jgi:hypothetical protein
MSKDLDDIKGDLREIKITLGWHWKTIALSGAGVLFIFYWMFVEAPKSTREQIKGDITQQLAPVNESLARLTATIESLKPDFAKRLPTLLKENLKTARDNPVLAIATAKSLIQTARDLKVAPRRQEIAATAAEVFHESDPRESKVAWETVTGLMNYQSVLNESESDTPATGSGFLQAEGGGNFFMIETAVGSGMPQKINVFWGSELVPSEESFRFERIGMKMKRDAVWHKSLLVRGEYGPINTVAVKLDGYYLKNVILRDLRLSYQGGPVRLENVYFVNCTFDIKPGLETEKFALAMLGSNALSFSLA